MPNTQCLVNHYLRNALLANLNVEGFDVKTLKQRMCDTRLQTAVPMSINGLSLRANKRPTTAHSFSRHGTTKNALTVHVTCFNSQTGFLSMFESQAMREGSINFEMLRQRSSGGSGLYSRRNTGVTSNILVDFHHVIECWYRLVSRNVVYDATLEKHRTTRTSSGS